MSAPRSSSSASTPSWPRMAAQCRGVHPSCGEWWESARSVNLLRRRRDERTDGSREETRANSRRARQRHAALWRARVRRGCARALTRTRPVCVLAFGGSGARARCGLHACGQRLRRTLPTCATLAPPSSASVAASTSPASTAASSAQGGGPRGGVCSACGSGPRAASARVVGADAPPSARGDAGARRRHITRDCSGPARPARARLQRPPRRVTTPCCSVHDETRTHAAGAAWLFRARPRRRPRRRPHRACCRNARGRAGRQQAALARPNDARRAPAS
jgi:hypothetical protein